MLWRILPHATACVASEKLFVLDVRQDRYFRVPTISSADMLEWLNRNYAGTPPKAVIETLKRAKILREGDAEPTNALKDRVVVPADLLQPEAHVPKSGLSLGVAMRVAGTRLSLRMFSLSSILAARQTRTPLPMRGNAQAALAEVEAFERARRLVPIARNCLLDSLALDRWLERRGFGSQLVFGILPEPFGAHCWLQTPEAILNDSYDHVSSFTPILAI